MSALPPINKPLGKKPDLSYTLPSEYYLSPEVYQPRAEYASEILAPEDISLCESVQRGLASKSCDQGTFIVDPDNPGEREYALHHFHRLVQQALS